MVRLKSLIVEIPDQRRYNATLVSEMESLSVFHLNDRIPYSSPLGWNGGEIFANSNGPYSFKGDGFHLSKWSKKFSLDSIVCDEKDYFLIEPADDFWRIGELDDEKYIDQSKRTPIKLPKNFQSLFKENIQPYLELKDFSYEYDPVG